MRRDEPQRRRSAESGYQLELGSKSLLALFFALAIVCGMFFAFGYTLGKHAVPATFRLGETPQPTVVNTPAPVPGVQPPNPAALGAAETNQTPTVLTTTPAAGAAGSASTAVTTAANGSASSSTANASASGSAANLPQSIGDAAATAPPPPPASAAAANPAGSFYQIQVFTGVQADAQSLAGSLQSRGYPVSLVPPAPGQSNLYQVQVGPYLTQAEAQAARSRLTADGYQAIIKTQ